MGTSFEIIPAKITPCCSSMKEISISLKENNESIKNIYNNLHMFARKISEYGYSYNLFSYKLYR